jgi:hypothetical protein
MRRTEGESFDDEQEEHHSSEDHDQALAIDRADEIDIEFRDSVLDLDDKEIEELEALVVAGQLSLMEDCKEGPRIEP